jgi:hypothetical protein
MSDNINIQKAAFTAGQFAQDAFRHRYREALASFDSSEVAESLLAHIRLERAEDIEGQTPDFKNYMSIMERSFLTLYDRKVLEPRFALTSLGEKAIADMRQRTGINPAGYVTPAPTLSPEQRLEDLVIQDWRTISADKIRRKRVEVPGYGAALERVLASNRLESQVTAHITEPGQ